MYDIALTVAACLRASTRVDVAWVLDSNLVDASGRQDDPSQALAITPGGGRVGTLYGGVLDDQLAEQAALGAGGRLLSLSVGDLEAAAAGLAAGGSARCLLVPATELPEGLWPLLQEREPVGLVSRIDGDAVTETTLITTEDAHRPEVAALWERGGGTLTREHEVVTALSPVATLVLAGRGPVLEALAAFATLLGWRLQLAPDPASASGLVVGLGPLDSVVMAIHDDELAGPVLAATLSGRAGYIAALGSRAKRETREVWLTDRGVTGLERIHTPAGLDIGAESPAEVAVAILAQAIAARSS